MRFNLGALIAFAAVLAVLSWMVAAPFWAYLVLGLVLATVTYPFHEAIHEWSGRPRLAAGATITATTLLILLPLGFVSWRIVLDIRDLAASVSAAELAAGLQSLLLLSHETFGYPATVDPGAGEALLQRIVPELQARITDWAVTAVTSAASFLLGISLTGIIMYYALIDGPAFVEKLKAASPMDDQLEHAFLQEAKGTVEGVVMGQLATAMLQGALGFLAFFAAGVPNAFFWGFMMAILSFLPVVGAFLVWFPAAIYLMMTGQTLLGVGVILWGVAVISTVDNIVKPYIIGKRGQVHALLAFVGVLGGLAAFGFLGFLIGPLVLSLAAAVFNVLAKTDWEGLEEGTAGETPVPHADEVDVGPSGEPADPEGEAGEPTGA